MDYIPIPDKNYDLNESQIDKWIEVNTRTDEEKLALRKFFNVTKYVSFEEFQMALSHIVFEFNQLIGDDEYVACLFSIEGSSVKNKSNYWVYKLMIALGLKPPTYIMYELDYHLPTINNFVFFDDGAFSGYQLFDTIYNTFLNHIFALNRIDINIYSLIGYMSTRSLNIFNFIRPNVPELPIDPNDYKIDNFYIATEGLSIYPINNFHIPIEELPIDPNDPRIDIFKEHVKLRMIYYQKIQTLNELLDTNTISILDELGIKSYKMPFYFAHKLPDYLSTYSEIYIGFTLKEPYDIIPLMNNCEGCYNRSLLKNIRDIEDIYDITREAPCPPPPYRFVLY